MLLNKFLRKFTIIILFFCLLGCQQNNQSVQNDNQSILQNKTIHQKGASMNLIIDNQKYEVELYQNETVQALISQLPITVTMNELNGNEKYIYLDQSLPSHSQSVNFIHAGDIMLFGNDCLVLFYEDFQTTYQYTMIGKLKSADNLKENLGKGSIQITFQN